MKAIDLVKEKIGKSAAITQKDIQAKEKFQQIFLALEENLVKTPSITKSIYLSNFTYRVFSIPFYTAIDESSILLYKEKILSELREENVPSDGYLNIVADPTMVRRSKGIGVEIKNLNPANACEVHVRSGEWAYDGDDDLYLFTVEPSKRVFFQFEYFFSFLQLALKSKAGLGKVQVRFTYTPL